MARYRAEIDGLRAIAVLAVVLFHARIPGFTGGYVGVDVFFVISGYLIAQLILKESEDRAFSFARFYERRVRRLLPGLLAMLAATSLTAWILLPADFRNYSASLVSVTVFLSNFIFWHWNGYFGLAAGSTPLLHTWSLAIEGQFYIAFPVCLVLLRRWGLGATALAILLIALASFFYSAWAATQDPNLAFYSPLSRAWELMVGALLATPFVPAPKNRFAGDTLAGVGLVLILYSVWHLTDASLFPGVNGLAPCLGTAMVIRGTQASGSLFARLLSAKPLVTTGLASYSLYLWHWPMIVFGTYYVLDPDWAPAVRIAMALAAFPVAFASWHFIERPFRQARGLLSRRALFVSAFGLSAALALFGLIVYPLNGIPGRFDATVQRLSAASTVPIYVCANRPLDEVQAGRLCIVGDESVPPTFVLWGDSHASVFHDALSAMARSHSVAGYSLTAFGCPPLLRLKMDSVSMNKCQARNELVLRAIAAKRPRVVILAAQWPAYVAASEDDPIDDRWDVVRRKQDRGFTPQQLRFALESTVAALRDLGTTVYFLEDVPFAPLATPDMLAKTYLLGTTASIEPLASDYARQNALMRAVAAELERQGALHILAPGRLLCGAATCRVTDGANPLYYDGNHLNDRGATLVSPVFEPVMSRLNQ